jgi:hypothetical protein
MGLEARIQAASLTLPELGELRGTLGSADDAARSAELVRQLHRDLLRVLTATDFRWGKAYSLGRALADTCRNPDDAESLRGYFGKARIQSSAAG